MRRKPGVWRDVILPHAAAIVAGYTAVSVTLRQLFYRLVADGTLTNSLSDYTGLARRSAAAREAGTFPDLIDQRHDIDRPLSFTDPNDARQWLASVYRRDRTEGQPYSVYIGNEKAGQAAQLSEWFRDRAIPVVTLGGWASQPYVKQVRDDIKLQSRPAILIYAGDFDPSGVYIGQDFADRVGLFDQVIRVGVNVDQLSGLAYNPAPPKVNDDPRVRRFRAEYGPQLRLRGFKDVEQFELDAFAPNDLRQLYEDALAPFWDEGIHQDSLDREAVDLTVL